jgi:hypothetical protein
MIRPITIEREVHFHRHGKGRKEIIEGQPPEPVERPPGRVPRVAWERRVPRPHLPQVRGPHV